MVWYLNINYLMCTYVNYEYIIYCDTLHIKYQYALYNVILSILFKRRVTE